MKKIVEINLIVFLASLIFIGCSNKGSQIKGTNSNDTITINAYLLYVNYNSYFFVPVKEIDMHDIKRYFNKDKFGLGFCCSSDFDIDTLNPYLFKVRNKNMYFWKNSDSTIRIAPIQMKILEASNKWKYKRNSINEVYGITTDTLYIPEISSTPIVYYIDNRPVEVLNICSVKKRICK
jgi:hypothetical protein